MERRHFLGAAVAGAAHLQARPVLARQPAQSAAGQPEVHLDRLSLPADVPGRAELERRLRTTLRREARRVDWGAGRDNRVEYRFSLQALETSLHGSVLRVRCLASGELPGGERAKSEISFGGAPSERTALVHRVVDVAARGVVARLAELERRRRGLR